ncbi:hypothetical protein A3D77_04805 [Candidatus Gottesmanbacteria bacterium RIFCSPHIGHO2_02_FULL_39_11]|uniref:Uncharacterized protein n=1 Tax=Candidatus Gottesmanbacteria bacterium RIFCSPHIGHO2_02_FULL_39_11 TaxID=1798382 RepID=A0A1F5ZW81_9BACT|nr:MAG: hypothetical protein A3D77_04805 [Candidatus Gottesmanbacteria bacterium RIFCSPHIGHO2_02_FULL_39_11]
MDRYIQMKTLVFVLFIAFPIIGFFLGMKYQSIIVELSQPTGSPISITPSIVPAGLFTYTNDAFHYSFQYTNSEKIQPIRRENTSAFDEYITVSDKKDNDISLLTIQVQTPPIMRDFQNEQEAMEEIVGYYSGSTSQYLSPKLNQRTGPVKEEINSTPFYRYEIAWTDDPKTGSQRGSGTDVWLLVPIVRGGRLAGSDNLRPYTFLWLRYDKKYEDRLKGILDSFQLLNL